DRILAGMSAPPSSSLEEEGMRSVRHGRFLAIVGLPTLVAVLAICPSSAGAAVSAGGACTLPSPFPTCTTTKQKVAKRQTQTLAPGWYGPLMVKNGATLVLQGGDYTFCALRVSRGAKLLVAAPATVRVTGDVAFSNGSLVGPQAGLSAGPCDLQL